MEGESTTEDELNKILKSNKCKSVKINGKNYWIGKKVKEAIKQTQRDPTKTEGGFIPLLGLIPGIIAGIGAIETAAGTAAAIASTVSKSCEAQANELVKIKKQKEIKLIDQKIKKENEQPKPNESTGSGIYFKPYGSGLYLKPYQATAMHKYFKNNTDIPGELTKKFKDGVEIEIESNGDGIYLKPYKNGS